ncbi:S1C family serine protease [Kineococcus indalonis]|uniref:S1C family serine protease n=1 Tax=Kineococcus indalonis TaxID=2696566 RepID=UPI002B1BE5EE|nr:trypsin-like peptidase domain-containing protein [Kineococcus indalonis]
MSSTSPTARPAARRRTALAGVLLLPLAVAGCTGTGQEGAAATSSGAASSSAPAAPGSAQGSTGVGGGAAGLEESYQQVIRQVLPSVVQISTGTGLGSGVVLDADGNIVTNAHVVGDATSFQVQFANSPASYPATLVGSYPQNDLAVVRVEGAAELVPARLGDSDAVEVGTLVLAMGNPLGLSSSVTNGIVSATGRTVTEPPSEAVPAGATLPGTIQTSAAINPGNSGGALVNLAGEVIGIPTLAATNGQQGGAAPGIGFAIPSNTARDIALQLVRDGRVTDTNRAALGVTITTIANASGQPAGVGVVSVEPGGAAERAGLRAGDVITSVADREVGSASELATVLAGLEVGQSVPVVVRRGGDERSFDVELGELPAS